MTINMRTLIESYGEPLPQDLEKAIASSKSQVKNTVTRENSICCSIYARFLSEDVASGGLFRGLICAIAAISASDKFWSKLSLI